MKKSFIKRRKRVVPQPNEGQPGTLNTSGQQSGMEGSMSVSPEPNHQVGHNIDPSLGTSSNGTKEKFYNIAIDFTGYTAPPVERKLPPLPLDPDFDLRPAKRQRQEEQEHDVDMTSISTPRSQLPPSHIDLTSQQASAPPQSPPPAATLAPIPALLATKTSGFPSISDPLVHMDPMRMTAEERKQRKELLTKQIRKLQGWVSDIEVLQAEQDQGQMI